MLKLEQKTKLKKILASMGNETDDKEMSILENNDIARTLDRNNRELKSAVSQLAKIGRAHV